MSLMRRLTGLIRLRLGIEDVRDRVAKLEALLLDHPDSKAATFGVPHPFGSPAVSVLMPTWNRAGIIGAAIRSVQAQSFQDWELIVVDDGSEDDTASVLRGFAGDPRIRYLPRDHQGLCHTRNHALAQARAPIIAYLDSDNVWYPGFLAAVVSTFAAEPTVDCVYGALVIDSAFGPGLLFHAYDRASLEQGNYIDVNTFAHRRTLFERYGGFDPALRRLDDWDLVLRYTAEKPPRRLPILAARYRTMDALRVTQTELIEPDIVHIRAKLDAQDSPRGR